MSRASYVRTSFSRNSCPEWLAIDWQPIRPVRVAHGGARRHRSAKKFWKTAIFSNSNVTVLNAYARKIQKFQLILHNLQIHGQFNRNFRIVHEITNARDICVYKYALCKSHWCTSQACCAHAWHVPRYHVRYIAGIMQSTWYVLCIAVSRNEPALTLPSFSTCNSAEYTSNANGTWAGHSLEHVTHYLPWLQMKFTHFEHDFEALYAAYPYATNIVTLNQAWCKNVKNNVT